MEVPRRWAVALASEDKIDLKKARILFRIGKPQVGEIKVVTGRLETALFSEQFEDMSEAWDVAQASTPIIDAINGICFIHDFDRSPLRRSGVHGRLQTGEWDAGTIFASATMSLGIMRATAFASAIDKHGIVIEPPQSQQSVWLQSALKDESALDVLAYLRGTPDWFLLYKAYEAMRADGDNAAGWPDTGRFTRSANIRRHFSGHSSAKQTPDKPFVPMELGEATNFVRSLATLWLNSKFPGAGMAPGR
jgi:hypothetical protein